MLVGGKEVHKCLPVCASSGRVVNETACENVHTHMSVCLHAASHVLRRDFRAFLKNLGI